MLMRTRRCCCRIRAAPLRQLESLQGQWPLVHLYFSFLMINFMCAPFRGPPKCRRETPARRPSGTPWAVGPPHPDSEGAPRSLQHVLFWSFIVSLNLLRGRYCFSF